MNLKYYTKNNLTQWFESFRKKNLSKCKDIIIDTFIYYLDAALLKKIILLKRKNILRS